MITRVDSAGFVDDDPGGRNRGGNEDLGLGKDQQGWEAIIRGWMNQISNRDTDTPEPANYTSTYLL